eukprot:6490245-Amphidinium_carterae.1
MASVEQLQAALDSMTAVVQQQQQQLQQQTAQIQSLHATAESANTRLISMQGELAEGRKKTTSSSKYLGKPDNFDGTEAQYERWAFKLKAMIGVDDRTTLREMSEVETEREPLDYELYPVEKQDRARDLYFRFVMLTTGAAFDLVQQITRHDGFEVHRRMCQRYAPKTMGRSLTRLNAILRFDFGQESGLLDRITAWEKMIEEHDRVAVRPMGDDVKCAVVQDRLPGALRTHLLLNAPDTEDWPTVKRNIQAYLIASRSYPSTQEPVPMDMSYLGKGKGKEKGGKWGKGKWGKDGGKQATNNYSQSPSGKDKKGSGKNKDSKGKQNGGKGVQSFSGYCGHCGKWGHKQKDCRQKNSVNAVEEQQQQQQQQQNMSQNDVGVSMVEMEEGWITMLEQSATRGSELSMAEQMKNEVFIAVDSGAAVSACGPADFPNVELEPHPSPGDRTYRSAQGSALVMHGIKRVKLMTVEGLILLVRFLVLDIVKPLLSVSSLARSGYMTHIDGDDAYIEHHGDKRLGPGHTRLKRRNGLFYLVCAAVAARQVDCLLQPLHADVQEPVASGDPMLEEEKNEVDENWPVTANVPIAP